MRCVAIIACEVNLSQDSVFPVAFCPELLGRDCVRRGSARVPVGATALPFGGSLEIQKFVEKLGSARCGAPRARFSARSHVSERRTGQSPSAAGGTEGPQGDSLCRLSPQTLSYMPDGASRFKETAENKNETTRRREGKACARYAVAQRKRVHAISTLLLSAGSTGSSPHPAPCGVSVGYPRVRSTSSTPDWVLLFSAFDFSARVRLFESTSRTGVCTRALVSALAAQPRPRLALAVFPSLCWCCLVQRWLKRRALPSQAQRRRSSYRSYRERSS